MALTCALALTSCATSGPSDRVAISISDLRAELVRGCAGPVPLPATAATRQQVANLWATDRGRLSECKQTYDGVVGLYQSQARRLEATGK